jgi:hypothetical protein
VHAFVDPGHVEGRHDVGGRQPNRVHPDAVLEERGCLHDDVTRRRDRLPGIEDGLPGTGSTCMTGIVRVEHGLEGRRVD